MEFVMFTNSALLKVDFKMSTPKNHHYVPKCYLKEFANSQANFYQILKGKDNIVIKNISQVCYLPNFYKLNPGENLSFTDIKDLNHIEKNYFKKQENIYSKLLKKISYPSIDSLTINKSELLYFLEILMTIKRRNPFYKSFLVNNYIEYLNSKEFQDSTKEIIEISKQIDKIDPTEYLKNYPTMIANNESKQSDAYLQIFLDEENKSAIKAAELVINYKVFILSAPFGSEFLTSDNPGFTITKFDNNISKFGGFGIPFKFYFPLTPKICLHIDNDYIDDPYVIKKALKFQYINSKIVGQINQQTFISANKKVFSYSKDLLVKYKA
jgi:Protein of unknown function (DUF4238)